MRERLRQWYLDQQMRPGAPALVVNPFWFARRGLWNAMRLHAPRLEGDVLDVGCGSRPYESLVRARRYVGLEIDSPDARARARADVYYDGGAFPFESASFDGVLCNQVLEHVFTPDAFVAELARVLRPGGLLLLTVPFAWDEHEQPIDFARYSSFGLRALLERGGFEVVEQGKLGADLSVLFQLLNAYLYKRTVTRNPWLNLATTLVLMAPVNVVGVIAAKLLPGNPDLYLDNVVLARRSLR